MNIPQRFLRVKILSAQLFCTVSSGRSSEVGSALPWARAPITTLWTCQMPPAAPSPNKGKNVTKNVLHSQCPKASGGGDGERARCLGRSPAQPGVSPSLCKCPVHKVVPNCSAPPCVGRRNPTPVSSCRCCEQPKPRSSASASPSATPMLYTGPSLAPSNVHTAHTIA